MARFRIFPGPRSAGNHVVQKIPQEIADLIFSLLPAPDQVCFSLSCKHLFACLHSYLKAQQQGMQLSQLLPLERRPAMRCLKAQKRPRTQLLLRLENDRWKYCSECWSLHPHSTWRALQSNWRLRLRQIQYDYSYRRPEKICDILYAGVVDLCPCLTITFRDKLCLIEKCRQVSQSTAQSREKHYHAFDYYPNFGTLHNGIWHICTFTDHPFAKVEVSTTLTGSTSLLVQNWYKFIFNPQRQHNNIINNGNNNSSHQTFTPWLPCPHPEDRRTRTWLEKFFNEEAGSSFRGWDKKKNHHRSSRPSTLYDWGECNQERSIIDGDVDEQCSQQPQSFELIVTRNLGNGKWPNNFWNHHCRK